MNIAPRKAGVQVGSHSMIAMLGVAGALAGLVVALATMPEDPRPAGAMFWPAFFLAAGLLVVPIVRARRAIGSVLRAEHFLMLALVYWILLDPLQSAYPLYRVSNESVSLALISIAVMAVGMWIGAAGKGAQPPKLVLRAAQLQLTNSILFKAVLICFGLGMFHFAFGSGFDPQVMIAGLGANRFAAPWSRSAMGGWDAITDHMVYFGYILPSLTVLLATRRGWTHPCVIVSVVLSAIMIAFLMQGGGRRILGVVIGASLITWMLLQQRLRPKLLIGTAVVIIPLLVVMQTMVKYRHIGFMEMMRGAAPTEQMEHLHVDDNFLRVAQVTAIFPGLHEYVGIQPLIYVLVRPIPRVLWPEKPIDSGYDLPTLVGLVGSWGTSLSHSIVGELYVMHGLIPVFLGGIFLGFLARMWSNLLTVPGGVGKGLVYGLGVMVLFVSVRSMQELVLMSYALIGWLIVARLLRWFAPRQKRQMEQFEHPGPFGRPLA